MAKRLPPPRPRKLWTRVSPKEPSWLLLGLTCLYPALPRDIGNYFLLMSESRRCLLLYYSRAARGRTGASLGLLLEQETLSRLSGLRPKRLVAPSPISSSLMGSIGKVSLQNIFRKFLRNFRNFPQNFRTLSRRNRTYFLQISANFPQNFCKLSAKTRSLTTP